MPTCAELHLGQEEETKQPDVGAVSLFLPYLNS